MPHKVDLSHVESIDAVGQAVHVTPELERLAKQRGFHSAEEMVLWDRQRSQKHTGSVQGEPNRPAPTAPAKQPPRPTGLAGVMDYISRALAGQL